MHNETIIASGTAKAAAAIPRICVVNLFMITDTVRRSDFTQADGVGQHLIPVLYFPQHFPDYNDSPDNQL